MSVMDNYHIHDKAYKYLFVRPAYTQRVLESFVKMDWVKKVDFKKIESLNTSFDF